MVAHTVVLQVAPAMFLFANCEAESSCESLMIPRRSERKSASLGPCSKLEFSEIPLRLTRM